MRGEGRSAAKAKFKQGQFDFRRPAKAASGKKEVPAMPAEPKQIETVESANTSTDLFAGSSLGELAQVPVKRNVSPVAGQRCQAPKGDGICGAVLSRHNPHTVPICQPCAERLAVEALRRGASPDIDKVWRHIQARRQAKAKAEGLADRTSGVREIVPDSRSRPLPEAEETPPKASVA